MTTKGRDTEQRAVSLYQQAGFETWLPPKAKFREQDVFGLFDLLAFGHGILAAVQVKTNRVDGINQWFADATPFEEHLRDWRVEFLCLSETDADDDGVEGWRLARPVDDDGRRMSYQWVYDGREIEATPSDALLDVLQGAVL